MITKPHTRPFAYPIIQEYASLGLDPNKIKALYTFDSALDVSGNQNHGTVEGATWASGRYGKALSFDGIDDAMRISSFNPVGTESGNSVFSVSLWAKILTKSNESVISQWDTNVGINQRSWDIGQAITKASFSVSSDGTAVEKWWVSDDFAFEVDGFSHWVFTFNGNETGGVGATAGNIKIYKNGIESSSYTELQNVAITDLHVSTADVMLACDLDNNVITDPYNIIFDNCLLYAGILDSHQIQNLYNKGL